MIQKRANLSPHSLPPLIVARLKHVLIALGCKNKQLMMNNMLKACVFIDKMVIYDIDYDIDSMFMGDELITINDKSFYVN